MARRLTTEEFIQKSKEIHQDKYDYSKVNYIRRQDQVIITCPIHGDFTQRANDHLSGNGCTKCYEEGRRMSIEQFISEARKVHGDKYDYSLVKFTSKRQRVIIGGPLGKFKQRASEHLNGTPVKFNNYLDKTKAFIRRSKEVHGDRYDYSKVNYKSIKKKVIVTCPIHGDFEVRPDQHLSGNNCRKCANEIHSKFLRKSQKDVIKKFKNVHGDFYDYSLVKYTTSGDYVKIICPIHGVFEQAPNGHYRGEGCPKCANERQGWTYTKWREAGEVSKNFDSFKVYIIRCWNENEEFYKIGKTFYTVGKRFKRKSHMPYEYEIIKVIEGSARHISELEHRLQTENSEFSYAPEIYFAGITECYNSIKNLESKL